MSDRSDRRLRVLVLDADQASALACVRSFGRAGYDVEVAERRAESLCAVSKYTQRSHVYADPLADPETFLRDVLALLDSGTFDLLVPVTDDTVQPLAKARELIERRTCLAVAPNEALDVMSDKARTLALAAELGVPFPRSVELSDAALLPSLAASLTYPVVLKPKRSITDQPGDVRAKLTVLYAFNAEELINLAHRPLECGGVLLQEYCTGKGVGVEVLCDRGEVVMAFQHEREHEMPLTGGGSCLRRAVPVDPVLLRYSSDLMRAVRWHGVAMVEFKIDAETGPRLMEVNGRFWGSLPLAVAAGADFPKSLGDLLISGRRPEPPNIRFRTVARKLSFDIFWFIEVMRRHHPSPLIRWPSRLGALLGWFEVFSPRHVFDVQSFADPRPGWLDLKRILSQVTRRFTERWRKRQVVRQMMTFRENRQLLGERVNAAHHILFVCYGNINRSPLAQHLARSVLSHDARIQFSSAGLHPRSGRPTDPRMIEAALRQQIHLPKQTSKTVDPTAVEAADLIFVMDVAQVLHMVDHFPGAGDKILLFGCLSVDPADPLEIADPFGGEPEHFDRCVQHVQSCVRGLARCRGTVVIQDGVRT